MDYKKYSLENLEKWIEDAINSSEASPQEIFDVIKNVVTDNYYCYKNHTERCYELLALLNGGNHIEQQVRAHGELWAKEDGMCPWGHSDMEYLISNSNKSTNSTCTKFEMSYQQAIDAGYTMTDDGFWIPPQKR